MNIGNIMQIQPTGRKGLETISLLSIYPQAPLETMLLNNDKWGKKDRTLSTFRISI